jgi:hypothetical protein
LFRTMRIIKSETDDCKVVRLHFIQIDGLNKSTVRCAYSLNFPMVDVTAIRKAVLVLHPSRRERK